ncbi:MAG: sulfatase-like hydrolase/transferase [Flagellimonas sp.]
MKICIIKVLVLMSTIGFSQQNISQTAKPNVVIILADDLGYGDISCYGQTGYSTPNIDGLAEEGVLFTDFYVPTPYCAPSRATLMTGRFPLRHGLVENPTPDAGINDIGINPREILLGEVFQGQGYNTMAIGKWHLGHKEAFFPVNHGFDEYFGILYSNDMRPVQLIRDRDTIQYPVDQNGLTRQYTEEAVKFISKNKENPFFLYLSHAMPHKPLAVSDKFYTPDTPNDLYTDVMQELDWSVGMVLDTLRETKVLENTIVIFMSDNGPWYGGSTGGLKGMKATTWEGGIRVPLILSFPKSVGKNTVFREPCWSPDIFPTLLSLTKTIEPKDVLSDGHDLTEALNGKIGLHRPIFSLHGSHIMSIRKGDYKLFLDVSKSAILGDDWIDPRAPDGQTIIARAEQATPRQYPGLVPGSPKKKIQLYNLKNDPQEEINLVDTERDLVEELIRDYNIFRNSIK